MTQLHLPGIDLGHCESMKTLYHGNISINAFQDGQSKVKCKTFDFIIHGKRAKIRETCKRKEFHGSSFFPGILFLLEVQSEFFLFKLLHINICSAALNRFLSQSNKEILTENTRLLSNTLLWANTTEMDFPPKSTYIFICVFWK